MTNQAEQKKERQSREKIFQSSPLLAGPRWKEIIKLIRPYQWIKNLLLFAPLFFSGHIFDKKLWMTGAAVMVFSFTSAIGYIVNDWMDKDKDRHHPGKKDRPLCSGRLPVKTGVILIFVLAALTMLACLICDFPLSFLLYLGLYTITTLSYSTGLKSVPILEIFIVAFGFVIRMLAGGAVCSITVSSWLFLTVFFIALMISTAKRVNEHIELGKEKAELHRKSQSAYSMNYLNNMLWSSGGVTLVVYSLYAVENGPMIVFSVIPAAFGIFRFLYLTDQGKGSDPIKTLFSDWPLFLTTVVFFLIISLVIYT